jgi:hypothetical protein
LTTIRKKFDKNFKGKIVRLENSKLLRQFGLRKNQPAVVCIRKGVAEVYPFNKRDNGIDIYNFYNVQTKQSYKFYIIGGLTISLIVLYFATRKETPHYEPKKAEAEAEAEVKDTKKED